MYEWLGLFIVCCFVALFTSAAIPRTWSPAFRQLVLIGAALRVAGALLRYEVIVRAYGGAADANRYFFFGQAFADLMYAGETNRAFSMLSDLPQLWGTQFLEVLTALIVTLVGPSVRGVSVVFAMLGYIGVVLVARTAMLAFSGANSRTLVTATVVWPSLWFWPSSIGKESIILLGIGLVVSGYVRKAGVGWVQFVLGLVVSFLVRPHIAVLLIAAIVASEIVGQRGPLTARRLGQLLAVGILSLGVGLVASRELGLAEAGGVEAFVEERAGNTETGGSKIERPSGLLALPMAFVNVLGRPFPWEARNPMSLLSALEMSSLWAFAWHQRKRLKVVLSRWRRVPILRLSLVLIFLLTLGFGLNYGNLGIIARQRVVIFPFIFIVLGTPMVAALRTQHLRQQAR